MAESVVALFSMETRRVRIRTGEITKESITDDEANEMINNLGSYLREGNYYEAWIKLIEDIDYYYNTNTVIVGLLFGFSICAFCCLFVFLYNKIKKCRSLPNDDNLKKIVKFLKEQKSNKKIFTENCAICLEKFILKTEINIVDIEEKTSKEIKLIDNKDDISTLNCGHQFHTNCIAKWMEKKNDCPLCRQKIIIKMKQKWFGEYKMSYIIIITIILIMNIYILEIFMYLQVFLLIIIILLIIVLEEEDVIVEVVLLVDGKILYQFDK